MARNLWSRSRALAVALLIALAMFYMLILVGAALPIALLLGWLVSSIVCLVMSARRQDDAWATLGFIELGGAMLAVFMWQGALIWWWPLGLVALGVAYVPLAALLPGRLAAGWRPALESSAPFVAGVGAIWELGQVITTFLLASQAIPLLAEDANALGASFALSSLLLVGGSLVWALLHRRLLVLALTALLLAQLAIALVIVGTGINNPGVEGLFALALLVVALACHVGAYPLRLLFPDLAPENAPRPWRFLFQRRGRIRAALAIKSLRNREAWGLCFLLDCFALLLALLAIAPVADQPTAGALNSGPLLIVLSAGVILSFAVAYWQQAPWLLLLAGFFLAGGIYILGLFATTPATTWPLLYFAATTAFLGLAVWLRSYNRRAWALPGLFVALGSGCLALTFALQRQSLAWSIGMALALALAALLAFWGWSMAQDVSQHP
ncbi:MAG TPA: hypothetical protein VH599_13275 [Ktedonobacterales bacterium]|jgi:hypothetical protein